MAVYFYRSFHGKINNCWDLAVMYKTHFRLHNYQNLNANKLTGPKTRNSKASLPASKHCLIYFILMTLSGINMTEINMTSSEINFSKHSDYLIQGGARKSRPWIPTNEMRRMAFSCATCTISESFNTVIIFQWGTLLLFISFISLPQRKKKIKSPFLLIPWTMKKKETNKKTKKKFKLWLYERKRACLKTERQVEMCSNK